MSLEDTLEMAVKRIRGNDLKDEEDSKQIIELILSKLGWDIHHKNDVEKEYVTKRNTGKKGKDPSVDYALKSSYQAPEVFIEAKKIGKADDKAEEQLFEYAANEKVLFLVLTDGQTWTFYAGDKIGRREDNPADRLFCRVKLESNEEEKIKEYASNLSAYLRKHRIVSTKAAENKAKKQYDETMSLKKAREAIPGVWRKLLETSNQKLRDLLVKEIKNEFEPKLKLDDVREEVDSFLKSLLSDSAPTTPRRRASQSTTTSQSQSKKSASTSLQSTVGKKSKLIGFSLDGTDFDTKSARETLAKILIELQNRNPDFMDHLANETVGTKNRLVAQNRKDLYTDSKFVEKASLDLGNGWWLGTSLSTERIRRHIETACDVAGVKFGTQLTLIEP